MSINTNAYGAASDWKDIFLQSNVPEDERVRMALFLDEPYPTTLPGGISPDERNGYEIGNAFWRMDNDSSYSILDENNPNLMDRSTTFVGIGGDSPYTKIRYISNEHTDSPLPANVDVVDQGQDEFNVVNTFFTAGAFGNFGNNRTAFQVFQGETGGGSQAVPSYRSVMWSPDRYDGTVPSGSPYPKFFSANNYNDSRNSKQIITQLPTKRIVWYPTITCSDNNDDNISTYDMHDYLTAYKSIKPRILSVQMVPVMDIRADITVPITTGTQRSSSIPHLGLGLNMELHGNLDGKWIGPEGSRTEISSENPIIDMFVGCDRGVALGGYITGKRYDTNANPKLGQPASTGNFDVQAIIDCGDMEWRSWSGEGNGKSNEYLFCDASNLTAEQIQESVRRAIACFGMFFADSQSDARQLELNANGMFLGTIEDDGIGYGDYTEGLENMEQPQWNWKTMDENEYDPTVPPGPGPAPTPDTDPVTPETPEFTLAVDNGSVCYVITKAEWSQIWSDIYGGSKSNWKDLIEGLALYGANPLNCILNYRWYPFALAGSDQVPLRLGSTIVKPSSHVYHKVAGLEDSLYECSGSVFLQRPKNFVESRKTKCRLFLPFYGYYELPMSMVIEKEISVKFQYNMPNDTGIWFIMFGGSIYDYVECQPYIEIPITGDNSLQIAAAKTQRNLQIAATIGSAVLGAIIGGVGGLKAGLAAGGWSPLEGQSLGSAFGAMWANESSYGVVGRAIAGAATGATPGIVAGAAKTASTVYNSALQVGTLSTNVPIHSTASDTTFLSLPFEPFVELYQNKMQEDYDKSGYKKSTGIACNCWKKISEMEDGSFLQVSTPVLDDYSGMEMSEIDALHAALAAGFYV